MDKLEESLVVLAELKDVADPLEALERHLRWVCTIADRNMIDEIFDPEAAIPTLRATYERGRAAFVSFVERVIESGALREGVDLRDIETIMFALVEVNTERYVSEEYRDRLLRLTIEALRAPKVPGGADDVLGPIRATGQGPTA